MAHMPQPLQPHSSAWVAQTWSSFIVAVGSTFSLARTVRDQHEAQSIKARIDDARVSRLIAEHDPLKPQL